MDKSLFWKDLLVFEIYVKTFNNILATIATLKKRNNINRVNKKIIGKEKYVLKAFLINQIAEIPENRYQIQLFLTNTEHIINNPLFLPITLMINISITIILLILILNKTTNNPLILNDTIPENPSLILSIEKDFPISLVL